MLTEAEPSRLKSRAGAKRYWRLAAALGALAGLGAWLIVPRLTAPAPPRVGTPAGPTDEQAAALQREVDARPDDPTLQLRLGNLHVERQSFDLAQPLLEKAAGSPQTAGAAAELLARTATTPDRAAVVLPAAQKAVAAAPGDSRAWGGLIRILYTMGRREPAGAALQEALRLFPAVQKLRFIQAEALAQEGRTNEAVRVYRSALKVQPDAGAQVMLGLLLARLRQNKDAQQAFTRAIELDPASVTPHLGLARTHLELAQLDQAEKAAYSALQVAPEDPEAAYLLARVLLARGDAASSRTAHELLDRVLTVRPDHISALYERGAARLAAGDGRGAVADLREVVAVQPDRMDAHQNLAKALRLAGDEQGAAEQLRLSGEIAELEQRRTDLTNRISENPRNPQAWADLGDFYLQHGVRQKAATAYRRALGLNSTHPRAREGLRKAGGSIP